jgi:Na+/proline symporter
VLVFLFVFVVAQLALGWVASRKIGSTDDYLVAGRRLGPWLTAISIFATWFGAESCIGAAGAAYSSGWGWHTTEPFAYGVCLIGMGLWFAAPLWRLGITTLADFFRLRFGPRTEHLAAVLLLPSSLLWAAAQIRAFGHIVATNSGGDLSLDVATALAAAVAVAYTVSGGLLADVYTDVIQGAILVAGLATLGCAVLLALPEASPGVSGPPAALPTDLTSSGSGWQLLEAWAVPICGSLVAQEAVSRSLAARSASIARRGAIAGGLAYLLIGLIPLLLGAVGPRLAPGLADSEMILPELSRELLPELLNLLFAGALIAAILSTVDSCLLVVASILTRNVFRPPTGTNQARRGLAHARWATVFAGAGAYALACTGWNVKELVTEASGFGSAGIFLLACLGVHSRVGGGRAAVACLLAGLLGWIGGRYVLDLELPYLGSLAAAGLAFLGGCWWERHRSPTMPSGAAPQ